MSLLAVVLIIAAVVCCGLCVWGISTAVQRSGGRRNGLQAH